VQTDAAFLRDVEVRMQALAEAKRLRPMVSSALSELAHAKELAAAAAPGSQEEHQALTTAAEISLRLAGLQAALRQANQDLQRTAYLVPLLTE